MRIGSLGSEFGRVFSTNTLKDAASCPGRCVRGRNAAVQRFMSSERRCHAMSDKLSERDPICGHT